MIMRRVMMMGSVTAKRVTTAERRSLKGLKRGLFGTK
jgi:hypothetical protein